MYFSANAAYIFSYITIQQICPDCHTNSAIFLFWDEAKRRRLPAAERYTFAEIMFRKKEDMQYEMFQKAEKGQHTNGSRIVAYGALESYGLRERGGKERGGAVTEPELSPP